MKTPRPLIQLACLAALAAAAAACSTTPEWTGTIEERDGAVYVSNPADPLWPAPDAGDSTAVAPVRFELEQAFGSDGDPIDAMLGNPYQVFFDADAEGRVYALDGQQSRLVAFRSDGTVSWVAGRKGEGPGEFNDARGLALNGTGTLAVLNHQSSRLDMWSTSGQYVGGLPLNAPPVELAGAGILDLAGFADSETVVLAAPMWGSIGRRAHVLRVDPLESAAEIEWNQLPEIQMPAGLSSGPEFRARGGQIMAGSSAGYRVRIYGPDGVLRREITRAVDYPIRSGFYHEGNSSGIGGNGSLSPPMQLPTGHLLIWATWVPGIEDPDAEILARRAARLEGRALPARQSLSSLDLFDPDGRFLYSILDEDVVGSIGTPRFVGPDGRLYTIADDPFPQIRRYRVEIDER